MPFHREKEFYRLRRSELQSVAAWYHRPQSLPNLQIEKLFAHPVIALPDSDSDCDSDSASLSLSSNTSIQLEQILNNSKY